MYLQLAEPSPALLRDSGGMEVSPMLRRGGPVQKPECPHGPGDFMVCDACLDGPGSRAWSSTPMVREYSEREYAAARRAWSAYLSEQEHPVCAHGWIGQGPCVPCAQEQAYAQQLAALRAGVRQTTDAEWGRATGRDRPRGLAAVEVGKGPGRPDVVRFQRLLNGAVRISVAGYPKVDLTGDDFDALKMVFGA